MKLIKQHHVVLGLGSNEGDSLKILNSVIPHLLKNGVKVYKNSSIYKSAPIGCAPNTSDFLNQVVIAFWDNSPIELLNLCQSIEIQYGRPANHSHWGDRPLDIDLLLFDNLIIKTERLIIPHPLLHQRAFVLEPLAEIDPELVIPTLEQSVKQILFDLRQHSPQRIKKLD